MLVYADENMEVIHRPGSSPYLLVTFNEMEMQANGSRFWGQRFCDKADIAALGFMSRRPNWFPAASIVKAVDTAQAILRAAPERVLYGHSQGGYAALRYRRRFEATVAIAFCPQTSIDAKAVPFDGRYTRHFSPDLHANMGISHDHAAGRGYIFFDPFHSVDCRHAEQIAARQAETRLVPVHMTGHCPSFRRNGAGPVAYRRLPSRRPQRPGETRPRGTSHRAYAAVPNCGFGTRPPSGLGRPAPGPLRRGLLGHRARQFPLPSGQSAHPRR